MQIVPNFDCIIKNHVLAISVKVKFKRENRLHSTALSFDSHSTRIYKISPAIGYSLIFYALVITMNKSHANKTFAKLLIQP